MEKPTKPFAVFTKQFAVAHGLKLALGNGAHWEYSRTHDPAQSVELRRKQAIADGPFCSEEDAAVGKTDCTPMLKLVPFGTSTNARKPDRNCHQFDCVCCCIGGGQSCL